MGVEDLCIESTARAMAYEGPLSSQAEETFWALGFDFYGGYPVAPGGEAVALLFGAQCAALGTLLERIEGAGEPPPLPAAGWFWSDLPSRWAEAIRGLPQPDSAAIEAELRARLKRGIEEGCRQREDEPASKQQDSWAALERGELAAALPGAIDVEALQHAIRALAAVHLPAPLGEPPVWPEAPAAID